MMRYGIMMMRMTVPVVYNMTLAGAGIVVPPADPAIPPITKQTILTMTPMIETTIPSTDKKDELPSKFNRNPYLVNFNFILSTEGSIFCRCLLNWGTLSSKLLLIIFAKASENR